MLEVGRAEGRQGLEGCWDLLGLNWQMKTSVSREYVERDREDLTASSASIHRHIPTRAHHLYRHRPHLCASVCMCAHTHTHKYTSVRKKRERIGAEPLAVLLDWGTPHPQAPGLSGHDEMALKLLAKVHPSSLIAPIRCLVTAVTKVTNTAVQL